MDGSLNPPNPKQRYGDLKVPLGLIPGAAKVYAALAFAEGAKKYGAYNWRDKAVEAMTYVHAAERHLSAWVDGEDTDPASGCPHLGHALACLSILADAFEVGNLIDDRPLPAPTAELLACYQAAPDDEYRKLSEEYKELANSCSGEEVPATSWPYPQDPCPLDGRNCPPDHAHTAPKDHRDNYAPSEDHPAFGEGDETTAYDAPKAAPHVHRWHVEGGMMVGPSYGDSLPIVDQKPGQYAVDLTRKHACWCDRDRCKVENGFAVGNNVFCCKSEAGK